MGSAELDLPPERWIEAVTAADLQLHGVEALDGDSPAHTLTRLALETGADLAGVGRCLALLRHSRCLLSGGAPLALLAYSPRLALYRASYDGACEADLSALNMASAGVWLTLLAGELGVLPDHDRHWLMTRLTETGVAACNPYVQGLADGYADEAHLPEAYEQLIGRAFWWCASHCLR
ncbi:MAG: hypothetical protein V4713_14095 [Pseudomonadota bacterium]